ncbi:uncharacterized protein LOC109600066 isoform X1 [Aethina tumida]|uniref:uncharacterized protein LOC109600066 isoform X1 n=1 Tax=Aethina tumida TaxID=116153 RepID=UPI002149260F|nr:uncharacterized protein LOC109600066 isoform X1 [Aethina tumida]
MNECPDAPRNRDNPTQASQSNKSKYEPVTIDQSFLDPLSENFTKPQRCKVAPLPPEKPIDSRCGTCPRSEDQIIKDIYKKCIMKLCPDDIMRLVEKENQDIETFARVTNVYVPMNPSNFSPKQKLQRLRLNSEAIALLYKMVTSPNASADDPVIEAPPETMIYLMNAMERKIEPTVDPTVQFNSLFTVNNLGELINMSPMAPGYFQDLVVPLNEPKQLQHELITEEIRIVTGKLAKSNRLFPEEAPKDSLFKEVQPNIEPNYEKIKSEPGLAEGSELPWGEEDLALVANIVGGVPAQLIEPLNVKDLEADEDKINEMQKGIDYYLEMETPVYSSKVQMRGTNPPSWFPGYIYASDVDENPVQIARSPSEVFIRGWKATHPQFFPPKSIYL